MQRTESLVRSGHGRSRGAGWLAAAALATAVLAVCSGSAVAESASRTKDEPATWEGLERVKRSGLDVVYIKPGLDMSKYRSVLLDPVEVSFDKNWDPKRGRPISDRVDPQEIRDNLAKSARETFKRELESRGGYKLVDQPGPDVLRVKAEIVDLYVNAPESNSPSFTRTYVMNAGEMTLVAKLFDSQTDELIARVRDRDRGTELGYFQIANDITNTAELERPLRRWADMLRRALDGAKGK